MPIAPLAAAAFAVATLLPWMSAGTSLLLGIAVALVFGNPAADRTRALAHRALAFSVMGLGAGMNVVDVACVGLHGLGYTAAGIGAALTLGTVLGRRLRVGPDTSLLVTVGTAICGGSAIAAVAPVLRAKHQDVSVALITVFVLNGVALWLFPVVGRYMHLAPVSYGLWCALAIHDTSSVIAAASQFGDRALEVATAAKLARALWIVPVTLAVAVIRARAAAGSESAVDDGKPQLPWFIGGFLVVAAMGTFVPGLHAPGVVVARLAHRGLALALYLVGLGFSRGALRRVGARPFLQALLLWCALAGGTLIFVAKGWID